MAWMARYLCRYGMILYQSGRRYRSFVDSNAISLLVALQPHKDDWICSQGSKFLMERIASISEPKIATGMKQTDNHVHDHDIYDIGRS